MRDLGRRIQGVIDASTSPIDRIKSLNIIKEENHRGPYFGLITVYPPEKNAPLATGAFRPRWNHPFVDLSGGIKNLPGKGPGKKAIHVRCGVGMSFRSAKRWRCVCKYSVATTDFIADQGNAVSLDSNNSFRPSSSGDVDSEILLKPAPKPVLKSAYFSVIVA
ncbi:hypothetical protein GH714_018450 [Hevea brasiliensis]|uniref:Uncharacterized protein n=1 Tax=Hevea brasiliensis TaxID=3981 RepID=A0A6A6N6E7_HEVBR|nr:hypothetical protein GH714_018450 [Hevea brasiliensis]